MYSRWPALRTATLTMTLLALLAACSAGTQGGAASTSSPTSVRPTATTENVVPSHNSASCTDPAALAAGDLRLSPTALRFRQLESLQTPDGAPLKPLALPVTGANGRAPMEIPGWFGPAGDEPPDLIITVCNTSTTKAHVIASVTVKFSAFTPYTGRLGVWNPCEGTYTRKAGVIPYDCGERASTDDETVRATFAANAQVGAIVPGVLIEDANRGELGVFPVTLPPGRSMQIAAFVKPPSAAGFYNFALGVTADTATLPFTVGQNMLIAPIAQRWTGQACLSPAMQAGLPANPPAETYFICPAS